MAEIAFLCGVTLLLYFIRPLSAAISASAPWRPVAAVGTISYSLYLIHQFNLTVVASIATRLLPDATPQALLTATIVGLHLLLATAFWALCERPFLGHRSTPHFAAATA